MRQCIDVILTRIFSVIDIKAGMPQTILRKHNIQRAQYLYNDSIGIELQVLERNNASRKRDIVKNAVTNMWMSRQQTANENLYLACRSRQKKRNSMTLLHIACH